MSADSRIARDVEDQYRRLLRWYPHRWRQVNEAAVLGMLLDDADHRSLTRVASVDKTAIILSACRERFWSFERVPVMNHVVLLLGVAYSAFYLFGITWAPGVRTPGSLGPFANPSVLTGMLLAGAWVAAAFRAGRSSRVLAWLALAVDALVAIGATRWHWFGPSVWAAGLFAVFAIAGAIRVRVPG